MQLRRSNVKNAKDDHGEIVNGHLHVKITKYTTIHIKEILVCGSPRHESSTRLYKEIK